LRPQFETRHRSWLACALASVVAFPALADDPPSNQELHDLYKAQQEQIDATADAVGNADSGGSGAWYEKTHLGGYGELHFNFLEGSSGAENKSEADFHRFVVFIEHQFSDKIRLISEIELEHALTTGDEPGEVELEQAFIEFDLPTNLTASAGLFLLPVGILNETHEPPTFYGVERNPVEKHIIPTTWWEGGGMLSRNFDNGFRTDVAVTTGLQTGRGEDDDFVIRDGR
jgi:hypothetical protein